MKIRCNRSLILLILVIIIIPIQTWNVLPNDQLLGLNPYLKETEKKRQILFDSFPKPLQSLKSLTNYVAHEPIVILNDSAFGPSGYNFPGTGTAGNPYKITGYDITDATTDLIYIENTRKYFHISNCILDGLGSTKYPIWLNNVTYGTIESNFIDNTYGIHLSSSSRYNTIHNNAISNSQVGIYLFGANYNNLTDNQISSCSFGISLYSSSNNNTITNNSISDSNYGIYLQAGSNNTLSHNVIFELTNNGIRIDNGSNNTILKNTISNTLRAVHLGAATSFTVVKRNTFLHSQSYSNALDYGFDNTYMYNFWDGWHGPDDNSDGFLDVPYRLYHHGLSLDGINDYAAFTDFAVSENFTIEFWVNPRALSGKHCFIGKHDSSGEPNLFLLYYESGFRVYDSDEWIPLGEITTGWQHLALTTQKINTTHTNCLLYRDGVLFSNVTLTGVFGDLTGLPWVIGQDWDIGPSTTDFLNGAFDDIRFVNQTLSAGEIYDDYTSPDNSYPIRADTVAWYHLNETGGTSIEDSSGNGNHGTTYNGPFWKQAADPFPRVSPIWIDSNDDFSSFSDSGIGTSNDPYIIELDCPFYTSNTIIQIKNTDVHFEIRNSVFDGLSGSDALIYLNNVKNGNILNNSLSNTGAFGIYVKSGSSYNTISGNSIHDCGSGIVLVGSSNNNTVSENIIFQLLTEHGSGIAVDFGSNSNTISENKISGDWSYTNHIHGIIVGQSSSLNTFSGNTITNCSYNGFYISTSVHHNTFTRNNISNIGGSGIFAFLNANNNMYSGNFIQNSSIGIGLDNSSDNFLTQNFISDASGAGISLTSASDRNTISYNIISDSTHYGVDLLYSDDCFIENNNFIDNNLGGSPRPSTTTAQAYDNGSNNLFNNNYWNDQTSGIYYVDPIDPANQDLYPRATSVPSLAIVSPLAGAYQTNQITVTLVGTAFHFWYYIEGKDTQNQSWTTSTVRSLSDGTYTLHVYSLDHLGLISHKSVLFTLDTTPPVVTIISLANKSYNQQSLTLIYTLSEQVSLTVYYNGLATNYPSGTDLTDLVDGRYNITIVAVDSAGNVGQTTVIFFVDTIPPTVSITSPSATTYTTSSVTITLSGSDVQSYWYYIDGVDSTNKSWTATTTRTLPNGVYTLHAYCNDTAGNEAHASVTFTIAVSTTTTTTTTTKKSGSFPPLFMVLLFLCTLVVVRRRKEY